MLVFLLELVKVDCVLCVKPRSGVPYNSAWSQRKSNQASSSQGSNGADAIYCEVFSDITVSDGMTMQSITLHFL